MKIQKVKPVSYDIHFEYACPNQCGNTHWLSLKECQYKGFTVVCECGHIFKPKPIKDITINFCQKINTKKQIQKPVLETSTASCYTNNEELPLPDEQDTFDILIDDCITTMCSLGFDKKEAKVLLEDSYKKSPTDSSTQLVKQTLLDNFGD